MLQEDHKAANSTARAQAGESRNFSVEVDSISTMEWDLIASRFADSNPEQTATYTSHHWKGRDSHLLLRENGEPVAGARVAIVKLPVIGKGLAFLRFGPFWRREGEDADPTIYRQMVSALFDEYCTKRGHCLTILPRPHPYYHGWEASCLRELGFTKRRAFEDAERYLVNTSLDEEAQRKSLPQKWRYNLRQAVGNGLEIRLTEEPAEIQAFQDLYVSMMERKHFSSTTPVHLTGELIGSLPTKLKPKLFVAFAGESLVAGATVGLFGDTAYYMFGATSAEALPLKAGYALHWNIVDWLHQHGYHWYDLGGAAHEPGLRQFKKGFVGKSGHIVVMEGEFDRWASVSGRLSADIIFSMRQLRRRIRYGAKFGRG
jgi:hypothetical protein